jgi:hypothetical protein
MSRPGRLEPNTNRDRPVTKQGQGKFITSKRFTTGEKGTYVGEVKGVHVHIVGSNTHLQIGDERENFDPKNQAKVDDMLKWLKKKDPSLGKKGSRDVHTWLSQPAAKRV